MIKLKILIVVHNFWPNFRAGTENATYFLARELAKKYEVIVFTVEPNSDKNGLIDSYNESGFNVIKVYRSPSIPRSLRDTYFNDELEQIFKDKLEEISPDIVHFQHLIGLSLKFISIAKDKNIPIFYTIHDFWFQCPRIRKNYKGKNCSRISHRECNSCIMNSFIFIDFKNDSGWLIKKMGLLARKRFIKRIVHVLFNKFRLKRLLNRRVSGDINTIEERNKTFIKYLNLVDNFISPSQFLKDEMIKFGIEPAKIDVINHGIDNMQSNLFKKDRDNRKAVHFCFLSHITRDKGFFLLVDSFNKLLKSNKNIKLSIFGSYDKNDRDIEKVLEEIEKNDYMKYGGVFDAKVISDILADVDVVVIPSLWQEIYGLVLDEAFNFGVPVIVSNRGGLPERVDNGINGLVFDPDKKDDLYEKIKTISEKPEILKDMIKKIPKMKSIEDYSLEIEKKYLEKYETRENK